MMETRFVLTGGLGNQLFQYAAALNHGAEKTRLIELETLLGKPRGTNSTPDLLRFKLTNLITYQTWSSLVNRALGYSLRISLQEDNCMLSQVSKLIKKQALSLLVSIRLKRPVLVKSPSDLGFDENFEINPTCDLVIGYFQSYKFASNNYEVQKILRDLTLVGEDPADLKSLRILAEKEKPLVVHIRRGDYRQENTFGLLSAEYYKSMIPDIFFDRDYKKIWLFSDDLPAALECIPVELRKVVRSIAEIDNSPAATLQAMRLGYGYVIANSSFSWWGAYLSNQVDAQVHAPQPWFKGMVSPNNLLQPQWISHPSIWE